MKILLWQNVISRHQKDLIESISKLNDGQVSVIYSEKIPENRENIGWKNIEYENVDTYCLKEFDENIYKFINQFDAHVFSGISSYPQLKKYFKYCIREEKAVFLYSEDKNLEGLKGKVKYLLSKIESVKYRDKIRGIFAIGKRGKDYFKKIGYNDQQIIEFGYYIKTLNVDYSLNSKIKLVFIGELTNKKGVDTLLISINNIFANKKIDSLHVYGEGVYKSELLHLSEKFPGKLFIYGNIPNDKLLEELSKYDYLILLSQYDGWGVVVNEALQNGCGVICSSEVGSSYLLETMDNCFVIKENVAENFNKIISNLEPLQKVDKENLKNLSKEIFDVDKAALKFINEINGRI